MKKSTSKFYLICIFLCAPFLIKAQNSNTIVSKADSLFRQRQYDEAMLGYEQAFLNSANGLIQVLVQSKYKT
jgi:hypothetical protein